MHDLSKYHDHVIEEKFSEFQAVPESDSSSMSGLVMGILRRWYIVLPIFLVICLVGTPAIWLLKKPVYEVTGAIRVAPILENIVTGQQDTGEISNYQSFMNTEAIRITSGQVVERVADDLYDKNLTFLEGGATTLVTKLKQRLKNINTKPEPAAILKGAITNKVITAEADRQSELINITMKCSKPEEGKQIVDAFIRAYKAIEVSSSANVENRKLNLLENELTGLSEKMQNQRKAISQLAQEYGSKDLGIRQGMKMERVASLLAKVTQYEAERIRLDAKVQLLKNTESEQIIGPEELLQMRNEYINKDPIIIAFAGNITVLEQQLIAARQTLAPGNPELKNKAELIETLKNRVKELKEEASGSFDDLIAERITKADKEELNRAQVELEQIQAYEQGFRDLLAKEDTETIVVGRTQVSIQDFQDELVFTKEIFDRINRRIREVEMELKRPARISVAYNADVSSIADKRMKLSIALVFGAMACGVMAAFLLTKADQRLQTPDDVAKRIGVRIIGTTSDLRHLKKAMVPRQIAEDYQTIHANLEIFNLNGGKMPKILVITSPGKQDGKTTFSINLATSMAKSGKKTLLIDGDLRKPDIAHLLGLPRDSRGLQDILLGKQFDRVVCSLSSVGLDVLAADIRNRADGYKLLALPTTAEYIRQISQGYDHVIIDTPPILAFPDALVWAKIADAVILTSFANRTTAPDLKEAKEKLELIRVRILGTVLSNVSVRHSYYRYASYYYSQNEQRRSKSRRADAKLLLPTQSSEDGNNNT